MDAMQNESATAEDVKNADVNEDATDPGAAKTLTESDAKTESESDSDADADSDAGSETAAAEATPEQSAAAEKPSAEEIPQPRSAEPEPAAETNAGKGKKRKAAPKAKSAAGTKSLVVFREGKVHYADETVVVLDLDDAAHPDTDVHDVVDKLSELRDAIDSPGRSEAVSLVAELIQSKALA